MSATVIDYLTNMCKACWGILSVELEVFEVTTFVSLSSNAVTEAAKCKWVGYNGLDKALTRFKEFNS